MSLAIDFPPDLTFDNYSILMDANKVFISIIMFPKRFKIGSARNNEWRCCFCLHVRTATILLGIWHLMLHILALAVLALLMRNHNVIQQQRNEFYEQNNFLPTPLSKIKDDDNPYYLPTTQDGRTIYSSDIDMGALMTVCTLSITLLMVYGTIRGKATHLLPFFCLQLFDFAITTLTATGYFCYLRSVHRLVSEHWHNLPFRNELLKLSPQYLSLIILAVFLISMLWKGYCISIVWRCYKYLTIRQQTLRNTIHYILPNNDGINNNNNNNILNEHGINEPDYSTLLRDQEAIYGGMGGSFSNILKQTPPPSYQDIMDDQPPPYPASLITQNPVITNETQPQVEQEPELEQERTQSPDSVDDTVVDTDTATATVAATTTPVVVNDKESDNDQKLEQKTNDN